MTTTQRDECKKCGLMRGTVLETKVPCMASKDGTYHDFGEHGVSFSNKNIQNDWREVFNQSSMFAKEVIPDTKVIGFNIVIGLVTQLLTQERESLIKRLEDLSYISDDLGGDKAIPLYDALSLIRDNK